MRRETKVHMSRDEIGDLINRRISPDKVKFIAGIEESVEITLEEL